MDTPFSNIRLTTGFAIAIVFALGNLEAQEKTFRCDPTKVLTAESCSKCHEQAVLTWKKTPHSKTFEQLHRNPRAKEICRNLGLKGSIKRNNVCVDCHYTSQAKDDRIRVVSGIGCESCHGAAKDWVDVHSDYGGPTATKFSETTEHRQQRLADSMKAGMRNPRNLYALAQSCLNCHTVPNEKLVNLGGHRAGSDFELVAWSQGSIRHNFVRSSDGSNAVNSNDTLRVMFVVGKIADLEFSTRATGLATEKSEFGIQTAKRAARIAVELFEIQK